MSNIWIFSFHVLHTVVNVLLNAALWHVKYMLSTCSWHHERVNTPLWVIQTANTHFSHHDLLTILHNMFMTDTSEAWYPAGLLFPNSIECFKQSALKSHSAVLWWVLGVTGKRKSVFSILWQRHKCSVWTEMFNTHQRDQTCVSCFSCPQEAAHDNMPTTTAAAQWP